MCHQMYAATICEGDAVTDVAAHEEPNTSGVGNYCPNQMLLYPALCSKRTYPMNQPVRVGLAF